MTRLRNIIGDMELLFLGNGDAFNYINGNNSSFFIKDKTLFLFDVGQAIFQKAIYLKLFDNIDNIVIFITHLHLDHIGSLGEAICFVKVFNKDKKLTIVYPHKDKLIDAVKLYPLNEEDIISSLDGNIFGINFHLEPAIHIENSYSYFIDDGVTSFYYSGDNSVLNQNALKLLKDNKLDYLYVDVAPVQSSFHLGYKELKEFIEPKLRNKVYIMHMNSSFDVGKAKEDGFNIAKLYK